MTPEELRQEWSRGLLTRGEYRNKVFNYATPETLSYWLLSAPEVAEMVAEDIRKFAESEPFDIVIIHGGAFTSEYRGPTLADKVAIVEQAKRLLPHLP